MPFVASAIEQERREGHADNPYFSLPAENQKSMPGYRWTRDPGIGKRDKHATVQKKTA